ncbi:uncharacterized protein L969DRAFT_89586 [Mixia osmundae IAM 14324]|uniref:[histone H3]-trimethyl-L-lysine(4) demethylase n=1 Tax=Mixia osmundae (strain CBS 9802 / IAM 14324 / JCM 22182 / KY 12970) TaxID=764103 RepID=G7EA73_MIXOS|nr:uncharacterized protein L969DRAFT_89586 [Mixia osmundae IAM 14324]KEI37631.1 hypothetical protein L969DRAFT_89586 [Mixia osmundae IAM 14324]GAA99733.1 hypothetical protein E5Q_06436 [Mixia osmundae IAM 14324]
MDVHDPIHDLARLSGLKETDLSPHVPSIPRTADGNPSLASAFLSQQDLSIWSEQSRVPGSVIPDQTDLVRGDPDLDGNPTMQSATSQAAPESQDGQDSLATPKTPKRVRHRRRTPPPVSVISSLDVTFDDEPIEYAPVKPTHRNRKKPTGRMSSQQSGPAVEGGARAVLIRDAKDQANEGISSSLDALTGRKEKSLAEQLIGRIHTSRHGGVAADFAPPVNFETIRTITPREETVSAGEKNRLFGLAEAPTYYPTQDEFQDPLKYIESLSKIASQYGICKVVPPEGWKPTFSIPTETFRFKTRLQRLNALEASARANLNFLEQLYIFHKQRECAKVRLTSLPTVNRRPVNLFLLQKAVSSRGGFDIVSRDRKWQEVSLAIGIDPKSTSATSALKATYAKLICPFEEHVELVKTTSAKKTPVQLLTPVASTSTSPATPLRRKTRSLGPVPEVPIFKDFVKPVAEDTLKAEEVLDEADIAIGLPLHDLPPEDVGDACETCHADNRASKMLLCDECDRGYHIHCLTPPLKSIPKGRWICKDCLMSTGRDFGFDEGDEHSFHSFRRRADEFKSLWVKRHPPAYMQPEGASLEQPASINDKILAGTYDDLDGVPIEEEEGFDAKWLRESSLDGLPIDSSRTGTPACPDPMPAPREPTPPLTAPLPIDLALEDYIEREFWRLVETTDETVEVEYGADLHTNDTSSGFPEKRRNARDPYARDAWNLNNIPTAPSSLLRHIRGNISGMTVPWLYVGMVFSTFAWHKEDHYTYSINYQHWGDTKTWYGVPGDDDIHLEAAVKAAAPELFEQQPDLMFQLVTLMSPGRLKEAGVRVYACDQRANEFVITFPRAYHAGFNHGLNVNEAVNFSLPSWLADDLACVTHYQQLQKHPVFSHDQLVCTIAERDSTASMACHLRPLIDEMVSRELRHRDYARRAFQTLGGLVETVDPSHRVEDDYQCQSCKCFAYLGTLVFMPPIEPEYDAPDSPLSSIASMDDARSELETALAGTASLFMRPTISDAALLPSLPVVPRLTLVQSLSSSRADSPLTELSSVPRSGSSRSRSRQTSSAPGPQKPKIVWNGPKVYCARHARALLKALPGLVPTFRLHYSDDELLGIQAMVRQRTRSSEPFHETDASSESSMLSDDSQKRKRAHSDSDTSVDSHSDEKRARLPTPVSL